MNIQRFLLSVFVTISALSFQLSALSEVPNLINYQGRLRDNLGLPLNGAISVQVALYTNETSDNVVFRQDIGAVPITNGVYSFAFGDSTLPAVLSNPEVWLQATVNGNILSPRQRLLSVPYAILAEQAGTVQGPDLSVDSVTGETRATWVTAHGFSVSDTNGAVYSNNWIGMSMLGGTNKWLHVGGITDETGIRRIALYADRTTFGGNVGIGTRNPGRYLEVADSSAVVTYPLRLHNGYGTSADAVAAGLEFWCHNSREFAAIRGGQQISGTFAHGKLEFLTRTDDSLGLETKMTLLQNGNLGVGTTSPTNKLHVMGGATFSSGNAGTSQNVVWVPGSASWSFTSDRESKDRLTPVDTRATLDRLARVPIAEWNYIGYEQRHMGPMAQDFHAQFPLNQSDDKTLNDADLHGVALAAIQGLNSKLEAELQRRDAENAELRERLAELEQLVRELNRRLDP